MRVLIDIPEQDYELACNYPTVLFGSYAQFIKKGTIIPDNATNGDMIKAMFPSDKNELDISKSHLMYDGLDFIQEFRKIGGTHHTESEDN